MAYTLEMVQKLEAAIGSGARSVRYGDQQVDYQTPAAMLNALAIMKAELGLNRGVKRRVAVGFSKGLD